MATMVAAMTMVLFSEFSALAQSKEKMNADQIRSAVVDHTLYYRYIRTNYNLAAVYFKPDGVFKFYCCEENGWQTQLQGPWRIENDCMCVVPPTGDRAGQNVCRTYYRSGRKFFADDIEFEKVVKGEE